MESQQKLVLQGQLPILQAFKKSMEKSMRWYRLAIVTDIVIHFTAKEMLLYGMVWLYIMADTLITAQGLDMVI